MPGIDTQVRPKFVTGTFAAGARAVPSGNGYGSSLLRGLRGSPAPTTRLALYDPAVGHHVGTSATQTKLNNLNLVNTVNHVGFYRSEDVNTATDILESLNINVDTWSNSQKIRAAQLVASGDVGVGWLRLHIQDVRQNDATAIAVGKLLQEDYDHALAQNKSGLQDASVSWNSHSAVKMAEKIIGPGGAIDQNFVAEFSAQLQNDPLRAGHGRGPHQAHLLKILNLLANDAGFQNDLGAVRSPRGNGNPARNLIRATLGLPTGTAVTRTHTKRAVLAALLAEVRQGAVGSCFATSVAVMVHDEQPRKMLNMLSQMVRNGCFTGTYRPNANRRVDVALPLNTTLNRDNYTQTIRLTSTGDLTRVGRRNLADAQPLHELPGVKEALSAAGFPAINHAALVNGAIGRLIPPDNRSYFQQYQGVPHTFDTTVEAIVNDIIQNAGVNVPARTAAAEAAFHAQMENPLMRAAEYTMAGFAETQHTSNEIRRIAGDAVGAFANNLFMETATIRAGIQGQDANETQRLQTAFDNFDQRWQENVFSVFDQNLIVEYNSDFSQNHVADDGHSTKGGFELSWRDPVTRQVTPIRTPNDLHRACLSGIKHGLRLTNATIPNRSPIRRQMRALTRAVGELAEGVRGPGIDATNMIQRIRHMQENPLGFAKGSNGTPAIIGMIYGKQASARARLQAGNHHRASGDAKDVLRFAVQQMRTMHARITNHGNHFVQQDLRQFSVPTSNGPHAFLLKPGIDPNFVQAWQGHANIDTWMGNTLNPVALQTFSAQQITPHNVATAVLQLNRYPGFNVNAASVLRRLGNLGGRTPANLNTALVAELGGNPTANQKKIMGKVLFEVLNPPVTPVVIADSNWGGGDEVTLFGVLRNPFTGDDELWELSWDGTQPVNPTPKYPLDQDKYVNTEWSLLTEPKKFGIR
ncbi:hypothetical protein SCOR_01030 [Sulfidibacter corallicola]|uniref:Uncharacterized protein n=1 Tax=Sulfidibacter corallicola TaxID=2818388 RepID=A0A8A4TJB0_SULCO|nr:hypothetical protein [Sulfidibacter corallicola]QTD48888.1 hypothetical protein J3U87_25170 [Sulfidibacter corallicola]